MSENLGSKLLFTEFNSPFSLNILFGILKGLSLWSVAPETYILNASQRLFSF